MNSLLYYSAAWLCVLILAYLCTLYITNKSVQKNNTDPRTASIKELQCRFHKPLGFLLIALAFLHGKTAGKRPDALALFLLLLLCLLPISQLFQKRFPKHWIKLHQLLTILLIIGALTHILLALAT